MRKNGTSGSWLIPLAFGLGAVLAGAGMAEAATPSSTTETFGHWTLVCRDNTPAGGAAPVKVCEISERLSVKDKNGQTHPLLEMALGTPPAASAMHLVVRVPLNVALRAGVQLSLDKPAPAGAKPATARPQEVLQDLSYLACTRTSCVADSAKITDMLARLKDQPKVNVSFTILAAQARKITVPVSLDGFNDALAALAAHGK